MAPIEHDLSNSNVRPLALFSGYLALTTSLLYLITRHVLYSALVALPPSQATRFRQSNRRKHVGVYLGMALLSLGMAIYHSYDVLGTSYRVWAYERGEPLPAGWYGPGGVVGGEESAGLQLGRWLHDTDFVKDVWEVAMEKSRRMWWTQQWVLGASAWSVYVAIEGRRRNIPHLWAFISMSLLVSFSFAQSLFFLAVLWTPVPLPSTPEDLASPLQSPSKATKSRAHVKTITETTPSFFSRLVPAKPHTWTPHPFFALFHLILSAFFAMLLPIATNTPSFFTALVLSPIILFLPIIQPILTPFNFGTLNSSSTETKHLQVRAFRTFALASFIIYLALSVTALLDNEPGGYDHRYLALFQHKNQRGPLERTSTGITRVLGSLNDHPAVSRIGWDVLLSGLSFGIWAGSRGLNATNMLKCVGWGNTAPEKRPKLAIQETSASSTISKTPKGRVTRRSRQMLDEDDEADINEALQTAGEFVGDEEGDEDWEAGALAWGFLVVGGLGMGAAGVLGAQLS